MKSEGDRLKQVWNSLHFEGFSWERLSHDQLLTWSTASWRWLDWDGRITSKIVVSSAYFHMNDSSGNLRSLIITRNIDVLVDLVRGNGSCALILYISIGDVGGNKVNSAVKMQCVWV